VTLAVKTALKRTSVEMQRTDRHFQVSVVNNGKEKRKNEGIKFLSENMMLQ
jgi:hypothetical protein